MFDTTIPALALGVLLGAIPPSIVRRQPGAPRLFGALAVLLAGGFWAQFGAATALGVGVPALVGVGIAVKRRLGMLAQRPALPAHGPHLANVLYNHGHPGWGASSQGLDLFEATGPDPRTGAVGDYLLLVPADPAAMWEQVFPGDFQGVRVGPTATVAPIQTQLVLFVGPPGAQPYTVDLSVHGGPGHASTAEARLLHWKHTGRW